MIRKIILSAAIAAFAILIGVGILVVIAIL